MYMSYLDSLLASGTNGRLLRAEAAHAEVVGEKVAHRSRWKEALDGRGKVVLVVVVRGLCHRINLVRRKTC